MEIYFVAHCNDLQNTYVHPARHAFPTTFRFCSNTIVQLTYSWSHCHSLLCRTRRAISFGGLRITIHSMIEVAIPRAYLHSGLFILALVGVFLFLGIGIMPRMTDYGQC